MSSAKKAPTSEKKPRAAANPNPFGLSNREVEIMILAWKCLDEVPRIDKDKLAKLAGIPLPDSAGRVCRKVMAIIRDANVEPAPAPGTPGTPTNGKGGDKAAADAVAAADPESPSLLASEKKKNKKQAGAGKSGGRKRVLKDMNEAHDGDEVVKNESDGDERPRKIPKLNLGKSIVTLKSIEAAEGSGSELEAGEA